MDTEICKMSDIVKKKQEKFLFINSFASPSNEVLFTVMN